MKTYADQKRRDVTYEKGEMVYLKLQPYRMQALAKRVNQKLGARNKNEQAVKVLHEMMSKGLLMNDVNKNEWLQIGEALSRSACKLIFLVADRGRNVPIRPKSATPFPICYFTVGSVSQVVETLPDLVPPQR
ncbi:hypothetical protein PIB30_032343 [Stylosanthes scabra]|uniref:Uncharacterized protein n=1 Tax=Stylosanthes scabra TaxID=79078 RepID=A0ABU6SCX6_9FABA|nr:hypothetical protein [Stylosanthes scabra]